VIEVSAKSAFQVDYAFKTIVENLIERKEKKLPNGEGKNGNKLGAAKFSSNKKKCCDK
jgi:hypothetical protein